MLVLNSLHGQWNSMMQPVRFLALGDSYTKGESVPWNLNWPNQMADRLKEAGYAIESLTIIANTGWRTDDLIRAINNQQVRSDYNLVSLLVGVNNQYQGRSIDTYSAEFEELLQKSIEFAGGNKKNVIVLSIPDYYYTPFGKNNPTISQAIDNFNSVNRSISEGYGIAYYDITPISRMGLSDPELVASDGLHPSEKMYAAWVDLLFPFLSGLQTGLSLDEFNSVFGYLPDPMPGYLKLHSGSKGSKYYQLDIYNLSGILVMSLPFQSGGELEVSLPSLGKGIYLYQIKDGGNIIHRGKMGKK
jgi:lysophospholipase L1-like esterase